MDDRDPLAFFHTLSPNQHEDLIRWLDGPARDIWKYHWPYRARPEQLPPPGDWRTWLVLAGRGFGKTRAGAEWVRLTAERDPAARIALVGATLHEARAVMVEGESGLLSVGAPWRSPRYESSLRRLTWPNGAQATLYSAGEPEALRGPQHSHACRPGTEGGDRERSPGLFRPPAPPRRAWRARRSPGGVHRRGFIAGRSGGQRRLGGTRRCHRWLDRRRMAPDRPTGRNARVRHSLRRISPVRHGMVRSYGARAATGRLGHRCRG